MWDAPLRVGRPTVRRAKRTLLVLSMAALASCRTAPAAQIPTLPLFVERGVAPLLEELVAAYPGPGYVVAWDIHANDSAAVENWLTTYERGFCLTAYTPRYLAQDEAGRGSWGSYWATPIGQDSVALIVHAAHPLVDLGAADLRAILTGTIADWSALGIRAASIDLIVAPAESSASRLLQASVLGDLRFARRAQVAFTPAQMIDLVGANPNAIGYVSRSWLTESPPTPPIRALTVDGVQPTDAEAYPLRAPLVFMGMREPDNSIEGMAYRGFFTWVQSAEGQAIVRRYAGGL